MSVRLECVRCDACAIQSPAGSRFCRSCGAALATASELATVAADPAAVAVAGPHVAVLVALVLYGFRTSLGGWRVFEV